MWGAISKFFYNNNKSDQSPSSPDNIATEALEEEEENKKNFYCHQQQPNPITHSSDLIMDQAENQETRQAKQRASMKWILSKAFNNRVPENLKEPFYRDHEGQEHLKPQIVVGLGNASLYCQTLSNLYSDPNYQSLNHWSILQFLTRKGVQIPESPEMPPLTETVLIQTNPIRINAHMAVIESLMILYAKEVASGDRVSTAIARITGGTMPPGQNNHETALLYWVSHVCASLKRRADQEIEKGAVDDEGGRLQSPDIPPIREYRDLCDGVCLAFLISYYCPKVVPWTSVRINYLPTVEDSIHNVLLVSNFSQKHLPYSVFHMTPEDITYMRGSMKQNLVVLLGDLFNLFELHPAKCVFYPGMEQSQEYDRSGLNEHGIAHRRGVTCHPVMPIPDLRSGVDSPTNSGGRPPFQVTRSPSASTMRKPTPPREERDNYGGGGGGHGGGGNDEGFVVHKTRGVPTLSSMQEPLVPARLRQAKEKSNTDTKADERGEYAPIPTAGRPSNWEDTRRPSYAGRRSRRNSTSEDSQLTIENFGGSQDQINLIGRTLERERKISNTQPVAHIEQAVVVRSTIADARGSIQIGYENDSGSEKQDRETEKTPQSSLRRQISMDNVSLRNIVQSQPPPQQHSKEKDTIDGDGTPRRIHSPPIVYNDDDVGKRKMSSFATLPTNQTTWQQQSAIVQQTENSEYDVDEPSARPNIDAAKLSTVRMKLEEKRRHIEQEKRKMEAALSRKQQKVGKAAFLQAINKGKTQSQNDASGGQSVGGGGSGGVVGGGSGEQSSISDTKSLISDSLEKPDRPCSLQDITSGDNIMPLDSRWEHSSDTKQTPDLDNMDLASYQQTIAMMNTNLYDLQADIQRLTMQQTQIQAQQYANMMQQQYGSQHNLGGGGYRPIQQNFGSTPHMTNQGGYNLSRPPSRDPHQNMQYINDQGQYVSQVFAGREGSPGHYSNGGRGDHYGSQYMEPSPPIMYQSAQPQDIYSNHQQSNQFYLHESPTPPPRRTWAQSAAVNNQQESPNPWNQAQPQKIDTRTWKSPHQNNNGGGGESVRSGSSGGGGFVLHQNGGSDYENQEQSYQNLFPVHSSPQHNRVHKQISQIMNNSNDLKGSPKDNRMPHSPPIEDMAPQSISFIGDNEDLGDLVHDTGVNLSKLNITSGTRTYRIPSPTRPHLNANSFQNPQQQQQEEEDDINEKGFYISFDNEQPKRPKPPLRAKKSPKKERSDSMSAGGEKRDQISQLEKELDKERLTQEERKHNRFSEHYTNEEPIVVKRSSLVETQNKPQQHYNNSQQHSNDIDYRRQHSQNQQSSIVPKNHNNSSSNLNNHSSNTTNNINVNNNSSSHNLNTDLRESKALVIGAELSNLDPNSVDEMERKKEKIMLLSLQRRQQQEETKARKEIESMQRREREQEKEDERSRRKDEQAARRQQILEAYKLKKAIEEAEREGKTLDPMLMKQHANTMGAPKLRQQKSTRPRPKTIHVDTGSVDLSEVSSLASRGKRGSNSNLTGHGSLSSNSMRRDYYRGSHDSLAIRESPDEYPSTSSTPLGRRGSYKTARDPPTLERGRTQSRISVAKGANFRGRKSNSLMNLCDTDSGLGRATPPRRAPSPGMGPSSRHLPSPSGPGSLPPGLMTKRRIFDDGSSDISSTPSSMMEYTGPKLYKMPATKSNRGIIVNAVEYVVFPGVVNRDAKQKVLDKIARSEAKHFLILFRDAGCQFRALYSYWPENETILKLYGTGPSQVDDLMFDKFFKYNSGGKCFSQIHTKHMTVTIDAFTIHNSLWQGKKVNLPSKKDMALVI